MSYLKVFILVVLVLISACSTGIKVNHLEELHKNGKASIDAQKFTEAIAYCKDGIEYLSDAYSDTKVIDDTSQKLALASVEKGKISISANLYCNVLESRISTYKHKLAKQ